MPEAAVIQDMDFDRMSIAEIIDERYRLDQQRKALSRTDKVLREQVADIDAYLLGYHEANPDVDRLAGNHARITFTSQRVFSPEDRERFWEWVMNQESDHGFLLTWSINNAAAREYEALHGEIPHTVPFERNKVSMRKT